MDQFAHVAAEAPSNGTRVADGLHAVHWPEEEEEETGDQNFLKLLDRLQWEVVAAEDEHHRVTAREELLRARMEQLETSGLSRCGCDFFAGTESETFQATEVRSEIVYLEFLREACSEVMRRKMEAYRQTKTHAEDLLASGLLPAT